MLNGLTECNDDGALKTNTETLILGSTVIIIDQLQYRVLLYYVMHIYTRENPAILI